MERVLSRTSLCAVAAMLAVSVGLAPAFSADRPAAPNKESSKAGAKTPSDKASSHSMHSMHAKDAKDSKHSMHSMHSMPGHSMMNMADADPNNPSAGMMMMAGMGAPAEFSNEFNWKITPKAPLTAKHPIPLLFDITWKKDGKPVTDLELMHEKPCHLVVLSKDLAVFQHIHPEVIGAGKFRITTEFPKDGEYLLVLQYMVRNTGDYTLVAPLKIGTGSLSSAKLSDNADNVRNVEAMPIIGNDGAHIANSALDGKGPYKLKIIGRPPVAGTQGFITAELVKDGKPVKNIEAFLGASGHGVMMSEDMSQFLHLHPQINKRFEKYYETPIAFFISNIKKPGTYRTWLQFKVDGKMVIGCWDVAVKQ